MPMSLPPALKAATSPLPCRFERRQCHRLQHSVSLQYLDRLACRCIPQLRHHRSNHQLRQPSSPVTHHRLLLHHLLGPTADKHRERPPDHRGRFPLANQYPIQPRTPHRHRVTDP